MAEAMGEKLRRLQMAAADAITEDDVREMYQAILQKAKRGDLAAARFIQDYMIGPAPAKPPLAIQVNVGRRARIAKKARQVEAIEHRNGKKEG